MITYSACFSVWLRKAVVAGLVSTSLISFAQQSDANQVTKIWGYAPLSDGYGGGDIIQAMASDSLGNVYFGGDTHGRPCCGYIGTVMQQYNAAIGKLDNNGNLLWSRELGD